MTTNVSYSPPVIRGLPSLALIILAALYLAGAILSSWNVISHSQASTGAIEQILVSYSMKNEGSLAIERYAKEHPLLGMFMESPVRHELDLPSAEASHEALGPDLVQLLKTVRHESSVAAWWSWFLLNLSLLYVVLVLSLERSFFARGLLFALAMVSIFCFVIGVLAPAMVIWTAPSIPMESGKLEFVLQHQVRGIAAIIWELLTTDHYVVGGFLLLFSIVTPLTKICLTIFVTGSHSHRLNHKIGQVLHSIGKWSMADVFVAGVILSLYALKAQEATKSIPCLGIYYFIGYCLLSMTASELLVHSGIVSDEPSERAHAKFGASVVSGLYALFLGFLLVSSVYTYQQYTLNTKQHVEASASPQKLNNADLVLPVHK